MLGSDSGCCRPLWLTTTLIGFRCIRQHNTTIHRSWMIRRYALTPAAVTLRLYMHAVEGHVGAVDGWRGFRTSDCRMARTTQGSSIAPSGRRLCESDGRKRSFAADSAQTIQQRWLPTEHRPTRRHALSADGRVHVHHGLRLMGYVSDRFMMERNPATTIGRRQP
jgi:Predicted membrane protein (DUF2306)